MAKQSMNVTLETKTIENIRKMAEKESRTVSDMIDYIVSQYMIMREEINSLKSARAAAFGEQVVVSNYSETQNALDRNVHIDETDIAFLSCTNERDK